MKRKWFLILSAAVHVGALGVIVSSLRTRRRPSPPLPDAPPQHPAAAPALPHDKNEPDSGGRTISRFMVALLAIGFLLLAGFTGDLLFRQGQDYPRDPEWSVAAGDLERGRQAILQHGCGACHVIPGIRTATGRVGPQLVDFKIQTYLAGVLPNTPENLVRWIQHPKEINPLTAMPDLDVTEQQARDMAAYIYARTGRGKRVPGQN